MLGANGADAVRADGAGFSTMRIGSRSEGSAEKVESGIGELPVPSAETDSLGLAAEVVLADLGVSVPSDGLCSVAAELATLLAGG